MICIQIATEKILELFMELHGNLFWTVLWWNKFWKDGCFLCVDWILRWRSHWWIRLDWLNCTFQAFLVPSVASIVSKNQLFGQCTVLTEIRSMYSSRYAEGAQIWASQGPAQCNQVIQQSFPWGETIIRAIGCGVWGWEQLLPSFLHEKTWDVLCDSVLLLNSQFSSGLISFLHVQARNFEIPEEKLCLAFISNNNTGEDGTVIFRGDKYYIPSRSVSILADCKHVVYNTKRVRAPYALASN